MFYCLLACGAALFLLILAIGLVYRQLARARREVHQFIIDSVCLELSPDSRQVIENSLEELMDTYRQMIPMGETFLRGSLAEHIKHQANTKIFAVLPHFQHLVIHHAVERVGVERKMARMALKIVLVSILVGVAFSNVIFFMLCLFNQIY